MQEAKQALKVIQHAVDAERALEQQARAQLDALEASKSRHQEVVAQQAGLAAQLASCHYALKAQKQMLLDVEACFCLPCSAHAAACVSCSTCCNGISRSQSGALARFIAVTYTPCNMSCA